MEYSSIGFSMAERIDIPSNSWGNTEFVTDPLVALVEIANDIFIVRIALVWSNPATHSDLKLSIFDKSLDIFLHLLSLPGVPHIEELHLNICEEFFWVSQKLQNDLSNNLFYSDMSVSVSEACEVIIVRFDPSDIIMSMGNHMDSQVFVLVRSIQNFRYLPLITFCIFFSSQRIVLCPFQRITWGSVHTSGIHNFLEDLESFNCLHLLICKFRKSGCWINKFDIFLSLWIKSECIFLSEEPVRGSLVEDIDTSITPSFYDKIWILFLSICRFSSVSNSAYSFYGCFSLWCRGILYLSTHLSNLLGCFLNNFRCNLNSWMLRLIWRRFIVLWSRCDLFLLWLLL